MRIPAAVWMCASLIGACGDEGGRDQDSASASASATWTSTSLTTTTTAETGEESLDPDETADDTDQMRFDVEGDEAEAGVDETGTECAALEAEGMVGLQPADIIVIVDNSGSMQFEADAVQNYMNMFSSQIFLANIDAHVVLLSSYPNVGNGICLDPPLGSGGCPADDNNPPLYTHIATEVGSTNGLELLIASHAQFAPAMRQTASKHIIFVTDDNSDLAAADFTAMWAGLDPSYSPFYYHAIAALQDPVTSCLDGNASGCCAISAAASVVHHQLVDQTGGVWGNLCDQEFQPIFDAVAEQVIAGSAIACEFAIPPPPDGETFDPMEVNVEFNDGAGMTLPIGYVETAAECTGVTDGWHYDNPANPTTIVLCSQTCEKIQGFAMANVSIGFGCATVPAG